METMQHLAIDLLILVISPRLCLKNYRALRRLPYPVVDALLGAVAYATSGNEIEPYIPHLFAKTMAAMWGEDDSWLDGMR